MRRFKWGVMQVLCLWAMCFALIFNVGLDLSSGKADVTPVVQENSRFAGVTASTISIIADLQLDKVEIDIPEVTEPACENTPEVVLTEYERNLLAQLAMAEAEGESEYGQRLVIDTVLNRLEQNDSYFSIRDVVYSPNQYSCIWNGRFDRCYPKDDILHIVDEECMSRTNHDAIFFTSIGYSAYGVPMFQEGNHYFSSY